MWRLLSLCLAVVPLRSAGDAPAAAAAPLVTPDQAPLRLAPGGARLVRSGRTLAGLPVFGGDRVELLDRASTRRLLRGAAVAQGSGRFLVGEPAATAAATAAVGGRAVGWRAEAGWWPLLDRLRAAWRVDVVTADPPGDWRVMVDAEGGRVLHLRDRRARASGLAYQVSPTERLEAPCPLDGPIRSLCQTPEEVELLGLDGAGLHLEGAFATVRGCAGADAFSASTPSSVCGLRVESDAAGRFLPSPDPGGALLDDAFSEVNAYAQVDAAARFLAALDPTGPAVPHLDVYVNSRFQGADLANAFFLPSSWSLVTGQAGGVDFAYDGSVLTHEVAHAWLEAAGGLDLFVDRLGVGVDAAALAEGSADAFTAAWLGRPELGTYVARMVGRPSLRTLGGRPTCRGQGSVSTRDGLETIDGLSGEAHQDGLIWSALMWELQQGLAIPRGCGPTCAAAMQAGTLRLLAGTTPITMAGAAEALVATAQAQHPDRPEIARYVACVAARHELATCDERTVPLHHGEAKALEVSDLPAVHVALDVSGAGGVLRACLAGDRSGVVLLRQGAAVETGFSGGGFTFTSDRSVPLPGGCAADPAVIELPGPGRWYATVILDEPTSGLAWLQATAGVSARPTAAEAGTCQLELPPDLGGGDRGGCGQGGPGAGWVPLLLVCWLLRPAQRGRSAVAVRIRTGP